LEESLSPNASLLKGDNTVAPMSPQATVTLERFRPLDEQFLRGEQELLGGGGGVSRNNRVCFSPVTVAAT
jgi:hypothetical protein